jgi:3-hydroxy acid dehydrogenase / malonic semialdehyde reductase
MSLFRAYGRSTQFLRQLSQPLFRSSSSANPTNPFNLAVHPANIRRTMASAMAKRLEGKTILITGASSGIGRSTAKEFARTSPKNLKIIVTARRLEALNELAAEIKAEVGDGVKVHPVKLDVSNPEEIKKLVPSLPEEFKEIDVLVNNA